MKAVRLVEIGKPLQEQEIPIPVVGEHDVLVQVKAAGICHSDVHYRAGKSPVGDLPQTLGHEVAGIIEKVGNGVAKDRIGERVSLHYLLTCGDCDYCRQGKEQFCVKGAMIGKHRDGGYAEYIAVPARNAVPLPEAVSFEQGAVLMCSTSTSFHALRKARLRAGENDSQNTRPAGLGLIFITDSEEDLRLVSQVVTTALAIDLLGQDKSKRRTGGPSDTLAYGKPFYRSPRKR